MIRCLVTGGRGFIGSHLVDYLKSKGHWVRSVDIKSDCFLPTSEDEFLRLDLRFFKNCVEATRGIDHIYNLAANMGGIGYITYWNAPIMHDNSLININMLEAARHEDVERYFFSSSACTYPRSLQKKPNIHGLKEIDVFPADPDSMYGWEKLYTELMMKSYHMDYNLPIRIARFHNVFGTHTTYMGGQEKFPAAVCRKVAEAKDGGSIILWGDGKQTRTYLYIDDCLDAIYALTQSDYIEPLNIGTDRLITVDGLARMVMKMAGKSLEIKHDLTKPQGVRGRNADLTMIKKILGWKPEISLEDGMERLYDWIFLQLCQK